MPPDQDSFLPEMRPKTGHPEVLIRPAKAPFALQTTNFAGVRADPTFPEKFIRLLDPFRPSPLVIQFIVGWHKHDREWKFARDLPLP
jgi:hypothetical protein